MNMFRAKALPVQLSSQMRNPITMRKGAATAAKMPNTKLMLMIACAAAGQNFVPTRRKNTATDWKLPLDF